MKNYNNFVKPKVYWIGYTALDHDALIEYLKETDQMEFENDVQEAINDGLDSGEILCSFYAKACYAALTTKKNKNISRTRSIYDNILNVIDSGHGSVLECCQLNFMIRDCSRVFCYDGDTEILTMNGWKKVSDLSNEDTLLTKNPSTGISEWQKNKKLHSFKYSGKLNWFESSQWESPKFTSDHIMWAEKYDLRKHRGKPIKEIKKSCKKIPYNEIIGKKIVVDQEIIMGGFSPDKIRIGGHDYDPKKLFFWLGLLVTDGTIGKDKNFCSIIQSKKNHIKIIRKIMKSLFLNRWKEYKNSTTEFRIFDKQLKDWAIGLLNGRLKSEISLMNLLYYDKKLLLEFIKGGVLGDGNINNNHTVLYCGYENLAKDWQVILLKCGISSNIREDDRRGLSRKVGKNIITNKLINYVISFHKNVETLIKKQHHKNEIVNNYRVYCPETDNGIVLVRRKGMAFWCGNTHELVRHRVGTHFSQQSGRFVRSDTLNVIIDPILEDAYDLVEEARAFTEDWYRRIQDKLKVDEIKSFSKKKKITSALRRMLPNGQANEIGFSVNLRSLRHTIFMRTSRHAEWEIRYVFNQIYDLVCKKYPAIFADATEETVEGLKEITFKSVKV